MDGQTEGEGVAVVEVEVDVLVEESVGKGVAETLDDEILVIVEPDGDVSRVAFPKTEAPSDPLLVPVMEFAASASLFFFSIITTVAMIAPKIRIAMPPQMK